MSKPKYLTTADFRRVATGPVDNSDRDALFTLQDYARALFNAHDKKDYEAVARIIVAHMDQFAQAQDLAHPNEAILRSYQYIDYALGYRLGQWSREDALFAQALMSGIFDNAGNMTYSDEGANIVRSYIPQQILKPALVG